MNINRLIWIDNIKCFAIILVVLGHLIQYIYFPLSFENNHLFRYIYSFHMPLFMVISGILTGFKSEHTINKNTIYSIKKRAVQLIFPFLSWAIISSLLKKDYCLFLNIIKEPDNGLWFLWVLFFIYIAYLSTILIHKYINNFYYVY